MTPGPLELVAALAPFAAAAAVAEWELWGWEAAGGSSSTASDVLVDGAADDYDDACDCVAAAYAAGAVGAQTRG